MQPIIRKIELSELTGLRDISIATFLATYGTQNTEQDIQAYCESNFSLESLRTQLINPESFFYVLELDGQLAGYIKLNVGASQTETTLPMALEIERIYVVTDFQGRKLGQSLLLYSIDLARSFGLKTVWLGVWNKNVKAIEFYEKNGFIKFAEHDFILGADRQIDAMMKFDL